MGINILRGTVSPSKIIGVVQYEYGDTGAYTTCVPWPDTVSADEKNNAATSVMTVSCFKAKILFLLLQLQR